MPTPRPGPCGSTDNPYGRRAEEVAQVLVNLREVEPRLRRVAHHEIDATAPLDEVLRHVLRIAGV